MVWREVLENAKRAKKFVQDSSILNPLAKGAIKSIPIVGDVLLDMWEQSAAPDNEKISQILETLKMIENGNEETFNTLCVEFRKNHDEIIKNRDLLNQILYGHYKVLEKLGEQDKKLSRIEAKSDIHNDKLDCLTSLIKQYLIKHSKDGILDEAKISYSKELSSSPQTLQTMMRRGSSVGLITLGHPSIGMSTGFLVGPNLVMAPNYLFNNNDAIKNSQIVFNYETLEGKDLKPESFKLNPEKINVQSKELMYSIISTADNPGEKYGWINLSEDNLIVPGEKIYSIHHLGGQRKNIDVKDNTLQQIKEPRLIYESDSLGPGTGGAPIFNTRWEIIGIHHLGLRNTRICEGVLIKSVIQDLIKKSSYNKQAAEILSIIRR